MAALVIVEHVAARTPDHAQADRALAPGDEHAVVAAAQVEPHLFRLARHEAPVEVRRRLRRALGGAPREVDLDRAVGKPAHARLLGDVGRLHVDLPREVAVIALGRLRQRVAPLLQRFDEAPAVERLPLGGHAPRRALEHLVREPRLQLARDLAPRLVRQRGQQGAVLLAPVVGEAHHPVVPGAEAAQLRHDAGRRAHERALVAGEGLVAVLGDRVPGGGAGPLRPAPLLAVPVEVRDEHVEQPRAQELAHVGALVRRLRELLVERRVVDDLDRAVEARVAALLRRRVLGERADQAGVLLAELAERVVVRQHHDARRDRGHARGLRQLVRDERRRRVLRGHLVLHQVLDERVLQLLGQDARRVLVDRAEGVAAPVRSAQREALRLLSARRAARARARPPRSAGRAPPPRSASSTGRGSRGRAWPRADRSRRSGDRPSPCAWPRARPQGPWARPQGPWARPQGPRARPQGR